MRYGQEQAHEAQIINALKQAEAGSTVEDVARECGVSPATIYAWKAKFGGLDVSEAQRLRAKPLIPRASVRITRVLHGKSVS